MRNKFLTAFFILAVIFVFSMAAQAACTPSSAVLTAISDDNVEIWINGVYIGKIVTVTDLVGTISFTPSMITQTNNIIRVYNGDNAASLVFTSWIIDVTCSDGTHSFITHHGDSPKQYYCGTCWDTNCTVPNDASARPWWDPNWVNPNPALYFAAAAVYIPISPFLTRLNDPLTGLPMDPISYNTAAGPDSGNGCVYFSYDVPLGPQISMTPTQTPTRTPTPPVNIAKSASRATANVGDTITFTITYQNNSSFAISNFRIWDTVPGAVSVQSILDGGSQAGGIVSWTIANVPAGGSGTVRWVAVVSAYPFLRQPGRNIACVMRKNYYIR
jgi:uncharacterized repeat protein (TIGR01451 family)